MAGEPRNIGEVLSRVQASKQKGPLLLALGVCSFCPIKNGMSSVTHANPRLQVNGLPAMERCTHLEYSVFSNKE